MHGCNMPGRHWPRLVDVQTSSQNRRHSYICTLFKEKQSRTSRLERTVEGGGCPTLASGNHSGWPLPCFFNQLRKASTKRSACVGVKVNLLYCALMSPPCARKPFSWPCNTIISPSYTKFDVQCSNHLGVSCKSNTDSITQHPESIQESTTIIHSTRGTKKLSVKSPDQTPGELAKR